MLRRVLRRMRALVRRDELEIELDEELSYHLERQIEQNIAKPRGSALRRAGELRRDGAREGG
jgi:hypothetical protein